MIAGSSIFSRPKIIAIVSLLLFFLIAGLSLWLSESTRRAVESRPQESSDGDNSSALISVPAPHLSNRERNPAGHLDSRKEKGLSASAIDLISSITQNGPASFVDGLSNENADFFSLEDVEKEKIINLILPSLSNAELYNIFSYGVTLPENSIYRVISRAPTDNDTGDTNQKEIIKKIETLIRYGGLVGEIEDLYSSPTRSAIYNKAASFGLKEVVEYLDSQGIQPPATENPIIPALTGSPSTEIINYFLQAGHPVDDNVIAAIEIYNIEEKYPEIYITLKKHSQSLP